MLVLEQHLFRLLMISRFWQGFVRIAIKIMLNHNILDINSFIYHLGWQPLLRRMGEGRTHTKQWFHRTYQTLSRAGKVVFFFKNKDCSV